MVSKEWREMSEEDRQVWNERSRVDKARYDHEMQDYNQARKLSKTNIKDPNAPRRPMSAFLAFSNKRRASLKREHPTATNADLSKMLSKSWKEFPHEMKKEYIEEEARLRAKYKADAVVWRKKKAEEAKASVAKQLTEEQRESSRSLAVATSTGSEISHQAAIATSKQEQSSLFPSLTTIPRNNVGIGFYPGSGNPLTSNDLLDVLHSRGFAGAPQNSIDAAILENLSDQLRLQRQVGSQQSFQQQLVSSITGMFKIGESCIILNIYNPTHPSVVLVQVGDIRDISNHWESMLWHRASSPTARVCCNSHKR